MYYIAAVLIWLLCSILSAILNGYLVRHHNMGCNYDDRLIVFISGPIGLLYWLTMLTYEKVKQNSHVDYILNSLYEIGYGKDDDEN